MSSNNNRSPERLMDIPDIARFCGVSKKTVRRWIASSELPAAKLGNQ